MLLSVLANTDETHHVAGLSVLYTNRAISRHKTGDCQGCVQDCTIALRLTPHSTKPLLRRAVAYEVMERYFALYNIYSDSTTWVLWLPSKAKITLANLAKVKKFPLAKSIFL